MGDAREGGGEMEVWLGLGFFLVYILGIRDIQGPSCFKVGFAHTTFPFSQCYHGQTSICFDIYLTGQNRSSG